jgi:hypothetical protein
MVQVPMHRTAQLARRRLALRGAMLMTRNISKAALHEDWPGVMRQALVRDQLLRAVSGDDASLIAMRAAISESRTLLRDLVSQDADAKQEVADV